MFRTWGQMREVVNRYFPTQSSRRKVVQLISIILVVEGISVLLLFSYVGPLLGFVSLLVGSALMLLSFEPGVSRTTTLDATPGMRLVAVFEKLAGGSYALMVVGGTIIILVVLYNIYVSESPGYGDVDTICAMFGGFMLIYPLVPKRWMTEATFAMVFLGFVVLFLAVPQALMSIGGGGGTSSLSNWYVHYMLAAPFAMILDAIGIPASSTGSFVTLQFDDGSLHTLEISAYCAGLYSFSIFISAFFAYVLVFERLGNRALLGVLGLGLLVAYLGNLLRMVVIGVVGYYWGLESLRWAHENAGWLIFIAWSALFWWIILGRVGKER